MSIINAFPQASNSNGGGANPTGTIISLMGKTAPDGYLACDGATYNISDYPVLAAYFKAQFGTSNNFGGNGTTTFAVPDLRGEFLRGTGTNSHSKQGSGGSVGVHQDATNLPNVTIENSGSGEYEGSYAFVGNYSRSGRIIEDNSAILPFNQDSFYSDIAYAYSAIPYQKYGSYNADRWAKADSYAWITPRPTNTSVLYCIKY